MILDCILAVVKRLDGGVGRGAQECRNPSTSPANSAASPRLAVAIPLSFGEAPVSPGHGGGVHSRGNRSGRRGVKRVRRSPPQRRAGREVRVVAGNTLTAYLNLSKLPVQQQYASGLRGVCLFSCWSTGNQDQDGWKTDFEGS